MIKLINHGGSFRLEIKPISIDFYHAFKGVVDVSVWDGHGWMFPGRYIDKVRELLIKIFPETQIIEEE